MKPLRPEETALPPETSARAAPDDGTQERPVWPAIRKGMRRRCPHCGRGALFEGYLKVVDRCAVCDESYRAQRADDGPAYLTILVVGHLMVPVIHYTWTLFRPAPLVMATIFTLTAVGLSLALLPRFKGLVVAVQWAKRMHGFGPDRAA
ncbi:DUF983 domain-containing protein [Wenxinia saemankumensis]|uniref:Uncharacterized conserved protein, DUF983 family n=1 Tax=Wenxinia saemankumensis TaxID=1447782 RepID=A0A1M6CTE3_9RHOB|nr:DUF983 domain-containing protein [Wenxinia saemankumensis]SHI64008.1 Uncharacterized conserved protein, DUF983 family [Wenxinia saemankumensis]